MNVTPTEVREAEKFARDQRMAFAPLMRVDATKVTVPAEMALLMKVAETAESDPLKWDALLGRKDVAALFARGALFFQEA